MSIILFLLLVLAVSFLFIATEKLKKLRDQTNQEKKELESKITDIESINQSLRKYQVILDAESKAREILNEAEQSSRELLEKAKEESSALLTQAKEELNRANSSSTDIRLQAKSEARALKEKADALLTNATLEAGKIIENANKRAGEIAGDAYAALKNVDNLEKTAQAMKNVIEGYGDQYLIPSYSLIDNLADEFGHEEAGIELKNSRERTRLMVKNGTAAKCEYVETNRKETAINFVTDAFNGKVDTILAGVRNDNFGTLEQKIKDAFHLVNNLGKPFKNASINKEYLDSRLEELKWASVVQELKLKEREEQRRIKEQIREEEKARREFEKAIKEAEREEELLKKAIEKVQKEVEKASEEQKVKYEEQLKELSEKLKVAEEKNQRAISMAQQTKTGHVYIISNIGSFGEHVYKIGMTRRLEPIDRVKELGDASVPFEFDVHSFILSEDAPTLERELHKIFLRKQMNKVNPRKEFFKVTLKEIKEEIDKMGINCKWTMAAEAREYKESLAIEKALADNTLNQEEWMKHQLEEVQVDTEDLEVK